MSEKDYASKVIDITETELQEVRDLALQSQEKTVELLFRLSQLLNKQYQ